MFIRFRKIQSSIDFLWLAGIPQIDWWLLAALALDQHIFDVVDPLGEVVLLLFFLIQLQIGWDGIQGVEEVPLLISFGNVLPLAQQVEQLHHIHKLIYCLPVLVFLPVYLLNYLYELMLLLLIGVALPEFAHQFNQASLFLHHLFLQYHLPGLIAVPHLNFRVFGMLIGLAEIVNNLF